MGNKNLIEILPELVFVSEDLYWHIVRQASEKDSIRKTFDELVVKTGIVQALEEVFNVYDILTPQQLDKLILKFV